MEQAEHCLCFSANWKNENHDDDSYFISSMFNNLETYVNGELQFLKFEVRDLLKMITIQSSQSTEKSKDEFDDQIRALDNKKLKEGSGKRYNLVYF